MRSQVPALSAASYFRKTRCSRGGASPTTSLSGSNSPASAATERRERALELLRLVGLQDFADAAPYELSGGMRQRVGIARALAPNPAILLMDEPFGALDSMTREQMQELLVDIWARTKKQIFFITHSIEEALFLGSQLIVMSPRPGRIVARYDLDFVQGFARDRDARAIKTAPSFAALREEIRAVVHQFEPQRSNEI